MNKELLKKYEIKTDKTDMLSSLKELPKDILDLFGKLNYKF